MQPRMATAGHAILGREIVRIVFDRSSNITGHLGAGWSAPEDNLVWTTGDESWLMLPGIEVGRPCLLSLSVSPFIHPGAVTRQRVAISVNGFDLSQFSIKSRSMLVCVVPQGVISGKTAICVRLRHPDHARPVDLPGTLVPDTRSIALGLHELTLEELSAEAEHLARDIGGALRQAAVHVPDEAPDAGFSLRAFQSVGDSCELGFVQRHCGVEPISLLRLSTISIANVTRGILDGFAKIGTPATLEITPPPDPSDDFGGYDRHYGILYHTGRRAGDVDAETLKQQETRRLKFLARRFMEDLAMGEQLFVVRRKFPIMPEEIARLVLAVRQRGPGTVLWVREADRMHPPGSAGYLLPGLMVGYVDRLDVPPLKNISLSSWLIMCRSAHGLWSRRTRPQSRLAFAAAD